MERVWQRDYATHGEVQHDITDYIMSFYNGSRLHSKSGYLSPLFMNGKWQQYNLSRARDCLTTTKGSTNVGPGSEFAAIASSFREEKSE